MLQSSHTKIYILILFFFLAFPPNFIRAADTDSISSPLEERPHLHNVDSLINSFCRLKFINIINEMELYYSHLSENLSYEERKGEIHKIARIGKQINCSELEKEAQFLTALFLSENQSQKIDRLENLFLNVAEDDEKNLKIRIAEALFNSYWDAARFADAFHQAVLLERELDNISEDNYPRKKYVYCLLGKAYFIFEDYEKALGFLRKSSLPSKYYFDTSGLESKNKIGDYFLMINEPDSAEFYYRSALYSTEHVKNKLIYDAVSMGNIGRCYAARGDCDEAVNYMKPALNRMLIDQNAELASAMALELAKCAFEKKNLRESKQYLDSARVYISRSDNEDLYPSLFYLVCKYYSAAGNAGMSGLYLDSVLISTKQYGRKYNSLHIAMGQEEFFENESRSKDEYIKQNQEIYTNNLLMSLGVIFFISIIIFILIYLLRKNKKAYHALVIKNQDWAQVKSAYEEKLELEGENQEADNAVQQPDEEDSLIAQQAHDYLTKNKEFKNVDLNLDFLAKELNVNRNYLSKAINKTTGKNFNTYINEYRVKEAIKMLSDEKTSLLSIDAIALEVGFGNRISFYQAFKKITGLSPSNFRNNKD